MPTIQNIGAVPSLTAKMQNRIDLEKVIKEGPGIVFQGSLIDCLDQKHVISIIMALGEAQRAHRAALVSDVLKHSESIRRARYQRLLDLIQLGVVAEVKTYSRQYNIKPLELTPLGMMIYETLNEIQKATA